MAETNRASIANALAAHISEKPDAVDFPTDAELAQWQTQLDRLQKEQLAVGQRAIDLQRERALPLQEILELDKRVIGLQHKARNLESIVRGEKIGGWAAGGIAPVK